MNIARNLASLMMAALFLTFASFADEIKSEKNEILAPYFQVTSADPDIDGFPLLSTTADVRIAGVIADVTIRQTYKNNGKKPLEAIYVFPASSRAAVYSMVMQVGERKITALIKEKEQARQIYDEAKKQGKSASLLEQQRPNVFTMNVANILPGDIISIELKYTELLVPSNAIYRFVFPTVVGPRYSNKTEKDAPPDDKFIKSPYGHQGEKPSYTFDIKAELNSGVPLQAIKCLSHKVDIDRVGDKGAIVRLSEGQEYSGNKDFILEYSLSGNKIETGLILSRGNDENFYLLMLQPPKEALNSLIPKREYIFILDVSGSMHGFPLEVSKSLISKVLSNLKPDDKFNIMFFSGGSEMLFPESKPASPENINLAKNIFDGRQGGGGTELLPALQKVMAIPKAEDCSRTFVIATDGYVAIEKESFDLITKNIGDANFFAFGIGSSVNRYLIEGIARIGKGESFIAVNQEEGEKVAEEFRKYISSPLFTSIKVDFEGFSAFDQMPQSVPDVFSQRPIIIAGKWRGVMDGTIKVSGYSGNQKLSVSFPVKAFATVDTSQALRYLWAREKLAMLSDYSHVDFSEDMKKEIVGLGIKYNLLTNYTSFVAVDYETRNPDTSLTTVKQPLPMPEGVEDMAMQGYVSGGTMGYGRAMSAPPMFMKTESIMITKDKAQPKGDLAKVPDTMPSYDQAALLKNVIYPEFARLAGREGTVSVKALIAKDGSVKKAEIVKSTEELLNAAALKAITDTKFVPGTKSGKPAEIWVTVPVKFKLDGSDKGKSLKWKKSARGTKYIDLSQGTGNPVKKGSVAGYHYKVYLPDGTLLETSYIRAKPYETISIGEKTSPNTLADGMLGMKPGAMRIIRINRGTEKYGSEFQSANDKKELIYIIELMK